MGYRILEDGDVVEIKKRIWDGELYSTIAEIFGVTDSYISLISRGRRYYDVKWPDGTEGPLPMYRAKEIHQQRHPAIRAGVTHRVAGIGREDFEGRVEAAEADLAKVTSWEECQKVIADDKELLRDAKKNPKIKAAIQTILGSLPRSQWSTKNIRQVLPTLMEGV